MVRTVLYVNLTAKTSGAEFSLLSLMAGLDREKFRPLLLLPEGGALKDAAAALGVETVILPSLIRFGEYFHFYKIPKMVRAVFALRKIIRQNGISLVHSNTPRAAYIAGVAAWTCRVPHVTHVRDIGMSPFAAPWKGRVIGSLSDAIICVSRSVQAFVTGRVPALARKTRVIYNGIDLAALDRTAAAPIRGELGIPDDAFLVGAIGRIKRDKGYDVLIDAAARLKAGVPSLRVLVIGPVFMEADQGYREELLRKVQAAGLRDDVFFIGFRADVLAIIKALDVVVHPALCPDSLPRVVLEAAGMNKAVVASRVGGIPEIVQDRVSGILVEPGNAGALADALLALWADPGAAGRLGSGARKRIASCFALKQHVTDVTAVYDSLGR